MENKEITGFAPRPVVNFLEEPRRGSVLMANSAGIYLRLDGKILLLCEEKWGCVPIGIGIPHFEETARWLVLNAGDQVDSGNCRLHLGGHRITITETKWKPAGAGEKREFQLLPGGMDALRRREKGLAPLSARLLEGDHSEETWNPWCRMACPRLEGLCRGLWTGDTAAIEKWTESLLGLGPGLTPSADDVLCGLVYGLLQGGHPGAGKLGQAICAHADSRTHPVSAAYLKAMANGEAFSRLEDAWLGRENGLEALLEVGSSSGADMLLGLCLAETLLTGMEEKSDG